MRSMTRPLALIVSLIIARVSYADLVVCTSEREEAQQTPAAAEDVRAYQACLQKWQPILPRAERELRSPAPTKVEGCEAAYATWSDASQSDPTDYDAMVRRLAARDEVEQCREHRLQASGSNVAGAVADPRLQAQGDLSQGRSWVILGSILLSVGGAGLTAIGAVGLALQPKDILDPVGIAILGGSAGLAAAMAIPGAIVLSFGSRKMDRARHTLSATRSR